VGPSRLDGGEHDEPTHLHHLGKETCHVTEEKKNGTDVEVLNFAFVVGKMRSGTAAVSEILHMMGCTMGAWFVAPQPPSWRSDWEDNEFNRLTFSKMPFGSTEILEQNKFALQMRCDGLYSEYLIKRRVAYENVKKARYLGYGCIGVKHPFLLFVFDEFKETLRRNGYRPISIVTQRPEYMVRKSAEYTIDKKPGGKETQEALGRLQRRHSYDYTVDYERLINKPEKVVRELAEVVGINDEEAIQRGIRAVKKPSAYNLVAQGA